MDGARPLSVSEPSRRWRLLTAGLLLVGVAASMPARAAILDSAPNGFTVEHLVEVPVSADVAWRRTVDEIGRWWSPDHTFSGDSAALSIDARPGGCFCERFVEGGARHMTVVLAWPGRLLRMEGALGPLQALGAAGTLSLAYEAGEAGGTLVRMTYRVGGYNPNGLGRWAPAVDAVLGEQLAGLQRLLDPPG